MTTNNMTIFNSTTTAANTTFEEAFAHDLIEMVSSHIHHMINFALMDANLTFRIPKMTVLKLETLLKAGLAGADISNSGEKLEKEILGSGLVQQEDVKNFIDAFKMRLYNHIADTISIVLIRAEIHSDTWISEKDKEAMRKIALDKAATLLQ